ncbi:response regulator transcription factor [Emticicia sp. 17c]|uniref:response regulator transcription factor n=1 Tax=Emticicia sp. 17c TaxID=3127704 RepID=UPI00301E6120
MNIISIGLVDDNPVLLNNISENLSVFEELHIDFKAINGRDALDKLMVYQPDVILMDIEMPVMDGIEATREIKHKNPLQKIIMLTVLDRDDKIFEAIKAGASGYLLKDEKPSKILKSIEELMDGGAPMSPIIAAKMLDILRKQDAIKETEAQYLSPQSFNLSKREIEILEKIASGLSYTQIADRLFISARTTRKHTENIYRKLHVHSKLEAIQMAQKNKWI